MAQPGFSFRQYWRKHHLVILGVVFTALCAIYAFLTYHFPLKQTPEIKTAEPQWNNKEANETLSTQDTPEKIVSEIEAAPPLQRDDISKTYIGIPVDWVLYFIGGTPYKEEYRLTLKSSLKLSGTYIHCTLTKSNNEYLRRLQEKTKLRVQGNIDRIAYGVIYLKNVKITPM